MATRKYVHVFVRTTFVGFHRWKDAPDKCAFLREWHRHVFHVELGVQIEDPSKLNREIEFLELKNALDDFIHSQQWHEDRDRGLNRFEDSCEMIADKIVRQFKGLYCEVSEDGENGARVSYVETPW